MRDTMNQNIAISLIGYFETLHIMNQKLIILCGDVFHHNFESRKILLDIIQDIPRVLPYSYDKKRNVLHYKNQDGLLEFKDELVYLEQDYNTILENNYDFLEKIRQIRNKYEHKMHAAKNMTYGSGPLVMFEYEFLIENSPNNEITLTIESKEFIKLFKELNVLFSKMQKEVMLHNYKSEDSEIKDLYYKYYKRMCRFDFSNFNKLYDSDQLQLFGQAMLDF